MWEYKGLLDLTGVEPVTMRVTDLAAGADSALWIQPLQLLHSENFRVGKAEQSASVIDAASSGN